MNSLLLGASTVEGPLPDVLIATMRGRWRETGAARQARDDDAALNE